MTTTTEEIHFRGRTPHRPLTLENGRIIHNGKPVAFVTQPELADLLVVPEERVLNWRTNGAVQIRFIRISREVRYPAEEVERFIREHLAETTAEAGTQMPDDIKASLREQMKRRRAEEKSEREKSA